MPHLGFNPLNASATRGFNYGGKLHIVVTYTSGNTPVGFTPDADEFNAVQHLLESLMASAGEFIEYLNGQLDELADDPEANDPTGTQYGTSRTIEAGSGSVSITLTVTVPDLQVPIGCFVFSTSELLDNALGCVWHTLDPEGFDEVNGEEESDDEDDDRPPYRTLVEAVPGYDFSLN